MRTNERLTAFWQSDHKSLIRLKFDSAFVIFGHRFSTSLITSIFAKTLHFDERCLKNLLIVCLVVLRIMFGSLIVSISWLYLMLWRDLGCGTWSQQNYTNCSKISIQTQKWVKSYHSQTLECNWIIEHIIWMVCSSMQSQTGGRRGGGKPWRYNTLLSKVCISVCLSVWLIICFSDRQWSMTYFFLMFGSVCLCKVFVALIWNLLFLMV